MLNMHSADINRKIIHYIYQPITYFKPPATIQPSVTVTQSMSRHRSLVSVQAEKNRLIKTLNGWSHILLSLPPPPLQSQSDQG